MPNLIHDGLTERAYLAPIPRLAGALRFEFRPLPIDLLHRFLDGLRGRSQVAIGRAEAELIAARLTSWSLENEAGESLPSDSATVLALHPSLFRRLREIVVYGTEGGDPDPEAPHDAEHAALIADSARSGASLAELREERDAKN